MSKPVVPLSEPVIFGHEWKYIKQCLDTGWVSSVGSFVTRFENIVARYVGTKYAVAVVSGTSALHLSLLAAGVSPGDAVIVPTLTFVAPANAVRYCGAEPVFMDCEPQTLTLDVEKFADFLKKKCQMKNEACIHKSSRRRIRAAIPVHVFGFPVDMGLFSALCRKHHIAVVEDATESLGSQYHGRQTGSFGLAGCFSFNGNKIITTGGGGMIVTDDKRMAQTVRHLSTQAKRNPFEYDHDAVGYNYRLSNIQAAMGVAQMEQLNSIISKKRRIAQAYDAAFQNYSAVDFLREGYGTKSNYWLNTIRVAKKDKKPLMASLLKNNIQVRPIWKLLHTLDIYKRNPAYHITNATSTYEACINIPSGANLRLEQVDYVSSQIRSFFKN